MFVFFLIGCALLLLREISNSLWWSLFTALLVCTLLAWLVI